MLHDFKLILRDPTDLGVKRSRPTPSASVIEENMYNFLIQWKSACRIIFKNMYRRIRVGEDFKIILLVYVSNFNTHGVMSL